MSRSWLMVAKPTKLKNPKVNRNFLAYLLSLFPFVVTETILPHTELLMQLVSVKKKKNKKKKKKKTFLKPLHKNNEIVCVCLCV